MAKIEIYHHNCLEKPEDAAPKFVWNGFFMGGAAGYECEACKTTIIIFERKE